MPKLAKLNNEDFGNMETWKIALMFTGIICFLCLAITISLTIWGDCEPEPEKPKEDEAKEEDKEKKTDDAIDEKKPDDAAQPPKEDAPAAEPVAAAE